MLENVIPGLRVTLKGVTTAPATLAVGEPALDRDAIKTKVKAFVDAYNDRRRRDPRGDDREADPDPASEFQAGYGQLYGDTGLQSMLERAARQMTKSSPTPAINDLGDLGVGIPKSSGGVVSDDAKAGKLTIDDAKLSLALESNWTGVRELLHRLHQAGHHYVDSQIGTGGVIDGRLKSADRNIAVDQGPADQGERAHRRQGKAPEGAVRRHGDRDAEQPDPAGLADRAARRAEQQQLGLKRGRFRADYRTAPTRPNPVPRSALSVYAPSSSAAYKQQSILTATPGQLVVMLYDGCLRFLHQAAYAMREGNVTESTRASPAPRRSSRSCSPRSITRRAAWSPAGCRASTSSARST